MRIPKSPKIGDIIKFKSQYLYSMGQSPQPPFSSGAGSGTTITISGGFGSSYVEVPEGTLAEIVDLRYFAQNEGMADNLELLLALAFMRNGQPAYFKINYNVHKDILEVLKPSKALKLLYEDK